MTLGNSNFGDRLKAEQIDIVSAALQYAPVLGALSRHRSHPHETPIRWRRIAQPASSIYESRWQRYDPKQTHEVGQIALLSVGIDAMTSLSRRSDDRQALAVRVGDQLVVGYRYADVNPPLYMPDQHYLRTQVGFELPATEVAIVPGVFNESSKRFTELGDSLTRGDVVTPEACGVPFVRMVAA